MLFIKIVLRSYYRYPEWRRRVSMVRTKDPMIIAVYFHYAPVLW